MTAIQWTEATWNPVTGCTEVSPGCDHCYAARLAHGRLRSRYLKNDRLGYDQDAEDPFAVRLWPERLHQPSRWKRPRMIFVNSMSDLFHKSIPRGFLSNVFGEMIVADHHIYQVLTKRPSRAADYVNAAMGKLPRHIWIGTSVEDHERAYRIRHLRQVSADVRFLSCEPLLGSLELNPKDLSDIHWVIVGGESGPSARPMDPIWLMEIRGLCEQAGIPCFVKQMGSHWAKANRKTDSHGGDPSEWPRAYRVREFPRVAATLKEKT